ncbi:MAG: hypothetical protein JXR63_13075 [Spirochaetales bacterium]|nr:hypothetical protein [Spirochaetales bacterium]
MINIEGRKQSDRLSIMHIPMVDKKKEINLNEAVRELCTLLPLSEVDCRKALVDSFKSVESKSDHRPSFEVSLSRTLEQGLFKVVGDDVTKGQIRSSVRKFLDLYL